jgi:hypothetical protein
MESENTHVIESIQLMDIIEPERIPEIISGVISLLIAKYFHRMFDDEQVRNIVSSLNG